MVTVREKIKEAMDKYGKNLSPAEKKMQEEALIQIFENDKSPAEAMGLTKANLEALYSRGYQEFQAGLYKEALKTFSFLVTVDNLNPKFAVAMGACYQMMKKYDLAINPYITAYTLNPKSPVPLVYLSDCYTKMGYLRAAMNYLDKAIDLMKDEPLYAQVLVKLTRIRENLAQGKTFDNGEKKEKII